MTLYEGVFVRIKILKWQRWNLFGVCEFQGIQNKHIRFVETKPNMQRRHFEFVKTKEREKKQVVNDEKIGWRLIAAIKACDSFCSHFWFAENNVFVKMITSRVLKKRVLKNCWQNNCHLF